MAKKTPITVAHGDGIGPEIMNATLQILEAAGAELEIETIEIGEKVYLRGNSAGIEPSAWDSLLRTQVFLKAPITTPQGGGFKSLNVTTRKTLGQYANVRPCVSYHPFIDTKHPNMDVVIVRENEEDLYAGIEYQMTPEVMSCIKLISRPGSEKIVRYAFEYARLHNRKKVTCFMKDNIMKMTDGLFHKVFDEIGVEYPEIEKEVWIVDIGAAKMADTPSGLRRDRDAESLRRHPERRRGADRGFGGAGGVGEYRREMRDVRGDPRLGAAACGAESGEPLGAAVGRGADAGAHQSAGSRGQGTQCVAAHDRRRRAHLRRVHGGREHEEGGDEGIRGGGDRAHRAEAEHPEAGDLRAPSGSGCDRRAGGAARCGDGAEGHRRVRVLAFAQCQCAG